MYLVAFVELDGSKKEFFPISEIDETHAHYDGSVGWKSSLKDAQDSCAIFNVIFNKKEKDTSGSEVCVGGDDWELY
jgi:hypothetical protein